MDSHGSHYRTRRFVAERQGSGNTTRTRESDRRHAASSVSSSSSQPDFSAFSYDEAPDDRNGRLYYWPVFVPPALPVATQTGSLRFAGGSTGISGGGQFPSATMSRLQVLADRAFELDSHSTGPGPSFVIEAQEPERTDEPRTRAAAAAAASRYRHNSRLMAVLLMDDRLVEGHAFQDWSKVYRKRLQQRMRLEQQLQAMREETRVMQATQDAKRRQLLRDAERFRADLLKCGQKEHLQEVARTMKVRAGQSTMPSNCKTAFRLKCVR
ncbi:hypothetical protein MTO96_007432 [Rhipicephalus appendiculatus]